MLEKKKSGTKVVKWEEEATTLTIPKCKLVIAQGDNVGKEYIIEKSTIRVGSLPESDLVINDETVSRNHLEIRKEKDGYVLKDLGSTNGTFINGTKVKEAYLHSGALIKIGKTEVKFLPQDEEIEVFPSKKTKFGNIIGKSLPMRKIFGVLERIAPTDVTVVIQGETGSGKEIIARAVHNSSKRSQKPFIVFDCSAVAPNLIESELFGHEKGSFTGAHATRLGAFELANSGTIFLDEIGELSLDLQPKLLRALEQRTIKKIGSATTVNVDVRVLAATNKNLEEEVKKGKFREDLYYRLSVVHVHIPPLRDRREDVTSLIDYFISQHNKRLDEKEKPIKGIEQDAIAILESYDWPGNVRELKNAIDRAITFCQTDVLTVHELPERIMFKLGTDVPPLPSTDNVDFKEARNRWIERFEKDYLIKLLRKNNLNISKAAKDAGIDRKSIQRLLKKYNLNPKEL